MHTKRTEHVKMSFISDDLIKIQKVTFWRRYIFDSWRCLYIFRLISGVEMLWVSKVVAYEDEIVNW